MVISQSTRQLSQDSFSDEEFSRLLNLAPFFGIETIVAADGSIHLAMHHHGEINIVPLSFRVCKIRLFSEICSRASPWVFFHTGENPKDSLLSLTDARLRRIAELYQLSADDPEHIDDVTSDAERALSPA